MITVQDMSKRYGPHMAVDHINFEVEKGRIVGFLGPNGAGKTTTMRVLTCFLPPSAGKASVAGFDVLEQPLEVKRRIGYLPETPPLYPEMEVWEYLDYVVRLKGLSAQEGLKKVAYALERCALTEVRHKLIAKLSKGFRQRVGLAQAILHDPEVLILDEPTSGLDPLQIIETRDLIKDLAGDHTILLSTHILSEVEQSCQEVIIINQGKLVATDTVEKLTQRLQGAEIVSLEVEKPGLPSGEVLAKLESVQGVARARLRQEDDKLLAFEVESLPGQLLRPELARLVVNAGWNLRELRPLGQSLEDIFLQLTSGEGETSNPEKPETANAGNDLVSHP